MVSDGLVLGFDTSAAHCAAALLRDGRVLEIKLWRRSVGRLQFWQHGMRAEFPLPARAREALGQALDRLRAALAAALQ